MKLALFRFFILLSAFSITATAQGPISSENAWELGWPRMQGPFGNFRVPQTGAELVDDLSQAKLVWESETNLFGRAKHTTGTFKSSTPEGRVQKILDVLGPEPTAATPGGWAAPIIAEGKLFATSFKPAGKLYDVKTFGGENPPTAKAHLEANDLTIAIDAKTGKTLWIAEEPGGFVWGVGKRLGFQVAPVYHDGKVFSMGTTGRLFAYNAADGEKLWELPPDPEMIESRDKHLAKSSVLQASANYGWQQSLAFAGETLVVPKKSTLIGLNPENGSEKWRLEKAISRWTTPAVWTHEEKEYLLCGTDRDPSSCQLNLIDPDTGKIIWSVDGLDANFCNLAPSDDHVLVNIGSSRIKEDANGSWPRNEDGGQPWGRLGAYKISLEGAEHVWSFPDEPGFLLGMGQDSHARQRTVIRNGLVFHSGVGPDKANDRTLIVAREGDGEILAKLPRPNDCWFQLIEDKLLYCVDWSHGHRASFELYNADPEDFRKLSTEPWKPEQPLTTSYQVLMEPPMIAGHIFWRTEAGTVVCYDLRK